MEEQLHAIFIDMHADSTLMHGQSERRAQSAMEYLTSYGWAILIIAIALLALYSFGVFNTSTTLCMMGSGFSCQDAFISPNGVMSVTVLQTTGYQINVTGISCSANNSEAGFQPLQVHQNSSTYATFTVQCYAATGNQFVSTVGSSFKGTIGIRYQNQFTGYKGSTYGTVEEKVTPQAISISTVTSASYSLTVYQPSPQANTIVQGQTVVLTDSASGGVPGYTYQWLAEAPSGSSLTAAEADTLCSGSSATTKTCTFATTGSTSTGPYIFAFKATDSASNTQTSSNSVITVNT